MKKDKIISFSVWGDSKLYCQGALDNIKCAKEFYPDWICRFYVAQNCPVLPYLQKEDCQVYIIEQDCDTVDRKKNDWHKDVNNLGMMWRFSAISDPTVERVIFRDTDSRVGKKDAMAVQAWENSGLKAHRMHECKEHWNSMVMGGMWGIKGGLFPNIDQIMKIYVRDYYPQRNEPYIFVDLWFIMDVLWPHFGASCLGHGFNHPNKFPYEDETMVGSVVNEEWRYEVFK